MTLKAVDEQHFYIDDKLVDLVWIGFQAKKQTNAANYHQMNRHLSWLNKLARRLLTNNITPKDEQTARNRLTALGMGWYFD